VVFAAKKLSDDTFDGRLETDELKRAAMRKYESLKDVVLN
jgi:hypothetical protein